MLLTISSQTSFRGDSLSEEKGDGLGRGRRALFSFEDEEEDDATIGRSKNCNDTQFRSPSHQVLRYLTLA